MAGLRIEPLLPSDTAWVKDLIAAAWGAALVVVHGVSYYPHELPGYVAWLAGERVGLATYRLQGDACELVTLNSLRPGMGIGTILVQAVKEKALSAGCQRLWLITTNDNLSALRFYQRQGFHLIAVHPDAVSESRIIKPEIPLLGAEGIPIRDELELEMRLA